MFSRRFLVSMLLMALVFASCQKVEEPSEPVKEEPAEEQKEEEKKEEQEEQKEEEEEEKEPQKAEWYFADVDLSPEAVSRKGYDYLVEIIDTNLYNSTESLYEKAAGSIRSTLEDLGITQDVFNQLADVLYSQDRLSLAAKTFINTGNNAEGRVEEYIFKYNTTSAEGEPIVVSGIAVFPNYQTDGTFRHTIDALSIVHDHLKGSDDYVSSVGSLEYLRVFFNQVVVMSDYEGYRDTGDRMHPYVSCNELARQTIDCALAALELLDYVGVDMKQGYKTYNMGMSKGGGVAVAAQKMLENTEPVKVMSKFNLAGTYSAAGLYDYKGIMEYYNDKVISGEATEDDNLHISWVAATAINFAYLTHKKSFEGVDGFKGLESFFSEDFFKMASDNQIFTAYTSWGSLEDKFKETGYSSLAKVLNPRFFVDSENSQGEFNEEDPLVEALFSVLDEENPTSGWTPRSPLMLEHGDSDVLSTYDVAVQGYKNLKSSGIFSNPYVTFHTYSDFDHNTMSGFGWVRMSLLEDPSSPVLYNIIF